MCETSMMPLRVAMPNSVMKPTMEATDSTPPEVDADHAADQRQRQIHHDQETRPGRSRTPTRGSRKMATIDAEPTARAAAATPAASLSNCPPYSTW